MRGMWSLSEVRWAGVATGLFAIGALAQLAGAPAAVWWAAYLACYIAGGWEPALAGVRALRERTLDVDLLMVVAAIGAAAIGQIFDGALLIVIFATSGAMEAWATQRTEESVRALLDLTPERATRVRIDGTEEEVDTAELMVGDVVLVRPGELIGADAEVLDGLSEVDQSSISGEALPVLRRAGDAVLAGTLNGTGSLTVRVNTAPEDSVLARIVAMVEQASATKARRALFIEKVEQRYSVVMVAATLALFVIPLLAGASLQPTLLRAMTFMIVASPCAVVLATMPPLLAAIANAGRHGVLVKSAVVMEQLGRIDTVAFDKTGTLTVGLPRVAAIHPLSGFEPAEILRSAAAAERRSEHPLARAVSAAAQDRGLTVPAATEFDSDPGRGVTSRVEGRLVEVGSPAPSGVEAPPHSLRAVTAELDRIVQAVQERGSTAVVVRFDGIPAGVLAIADQVRSDAAGAVAALGQLTGYPPVLLTGDNFGAAGCLADEVGITEVHAGLLPADKVEHVRAIRASGRRVLLVGDGVNDAPAMTAADVGVAMGRRGSDLALETSDVVIVRDELDALATAVDLSRRAGRLITANLIFAAAVILVLVVWDLVGHLPLPLGVAGHEGSTIIVGLNGLRLLRSAAWRRAGGRTAAPPTSRSVAADPVAARTSGPG